jgi:hypothetical protein
MSADAHDDPPDPAIEDAVAFLRGHLSGTLRFDGDFRPMKVAVAPDGALIASAMVAMIRSVDLTLYLPDEEESSMHLHVSIEEFADAGEGAALADRWRMYHGDPPDVRWARMTIDAARFDGLFIDGEALMWRNPLAASEGKICRTLNTNHVDLLRAACLAHAQVGIEKPVAVGVDRFGIDVRGAFDIVRLDGHTEIRNESDAISTLQAMARPR